MTSLFSVYKSEYARKRFASSELTYLLGSYLKVDIRIPYSFRAQSAKKNRHFGCACIICNRT